MNTTSKTKVQIALWGGSILIVIAVGLYYFPLEYESHGFWETLYITLRLFVFEHDLPDFPKAWPLVFIYFGAPLITISAVGTAISYLLSASPVLKTLFLSDHVVICGVGRTGKLFASVLRKKGVRVVGVDLGPPSDLHEWSDRDKVPIIVGDFGSRAILEKAGVGKARSIVFASGNDIANLDGALSAYEWLETTEGPVRFIWAQITNELLADTARSVVRTQGKVRIRFFDTYRIAATRLVEKHFKSDVRKGITETNILGFGKFGRDLFEVLVTGLNKDERFAVRVVDVNDRESAVRSLAEQLGVADRVTFVKAAIQDISLVGDKDKAFFICTDDDLGNLTTAMSLVSEGYSAHTYVRMHHWPLSAVKEHLGEDRGVFFVNINDLVVQGIQELPGIFEPVSAADLKSEQHFC